MKHTYLTHGVVAKETVTKIKYSVQGVRIGVPDTDYDAISVNSFSRFRAFEAGTRIVITYGVFRPFNG